MTPIKYKSSSLILLLAIFTGFPTIARGGNEGRGGGTLEAAAWKKETLQMIDKLEPYKALLPQWFDLQSFRTEIEDSKVFAVKTLPAKFMSKHKTDLRFEGLAIDPATRSVFFELKPESSGLSRIYWYLRFSHDPKSALVKVREIAPYTAPFANTSQTIDLKPDTFEAYSGGMRNFYRESYMDYAERFASALKNIPADQVPQWFDIPLFQSVVRTANIQVVDQLVLPRDVDGTVAEVLQAFSDRSMKLTQVKTSFFEERNRFEMGRLLLHEFFVLSGFETDGDYSKSEVVSQLSFGDIWNQPYYRWERSWDKSNVADKICRRFQSDVEKSASEAIAKDLNLRSEFDLGRISFETRLKLVDSTIAPYLSNTYPSYCQSLITLNTMKYRVIQKYISGELRPHQTCSDVLRSPASLPSDLERSYVIYSVSHGKYLIGKQPYCHGEATMIVPTDSEVYRSKFLWM